MFSDKTTSTYMSNTRCFIKATKQNIKKLDARYIKNEHFRTTMKPKERSTSASLLVNSFLKTRRKRDKLHLLTLKWHDRKNPNQLMLKSLS